MPGPFPESRIATSTLVRRSIIAVEILVNSKMLIQPEALD